ncbi:hypothetical protein LJR066_003749 [Acidovorax sp. LjRoot66]|uniref:hypothetical protein n=1 Tax=Acidovorax sp. LjRoot66 TaxID=3342334 RepID=UPI003ED0FEE0
MEYVDFVVSWLGGNPRMVTAWAVVLMLALAWLWRGHRANKERARFKPLPRSRAKQAATKGVSAVVTPKAQRRVRPRR